MPEQNERDKGAGKKQKAKKPVEYRRFQRLLKHVIKAAPLRGRSRLDQSTTT